MTISQGLMHLLHS